MTQIAKNVQAQDLHAHPAKETCIFTTHNVSLPVPSQLFRAALPAQTATQHVLNVLLQLTYAPFARLAFISMNLNAKNVQTGGLEMMKLGTVMKKMGRLQLL